MTGPGMKFQRAGELLAQARQICEALGDDKPVDSAFLVHTSAVVSDLIELTEALLAERQAYESRLHRSPARVAVTTELGADSE